MGPEAEGVSWDAVGKRVALATPKYYRMTDHPEEGFLPKNRRFWLETLVEDMLGRRLILPESDYKRDMETAASLVLALYLQGFQTLVGVPKKGLSILREVAPQIGHNSPVFSSKRVKRKEIQGQKVLLFDDTIHEGKTITKQAKKILDMEPASLAVVGLWCSKDGINEFRASFPSKKFSNVQFFSVAPVPEKLFWLMFQLYVSPILYSLKGGAISNRPFDTIEISRNGRPLEDVAVDVLVALAKLPCVQTFVENPPLDGLQWPTFHGELEPVVAIDEKFRQALGPVAEDIEYSKIRVFVHAGSQLVVYLCGCLCPVGLTCESPEAAESVDNEWSCKLLDAAWTELEPALKQLGLDVTRKQQEMG